MSKIVTSLFCGGRGSAALIRELIRRPEVKLNLLINAYDDGLSTGEIRAFIPGMLGPSDFRKNLSYLLDLHSNEQYGLTNFLEYRFPIPTGENDITELSEALKDAAKICRLEPKLRDIIRLVDSSSLQRIREYVMIFVDYCRGQNKPFNFSDCSLGNILFAGAFVKSGGRFNQATVELATLFGSKARLINVTTGENRILVALKEDGEILDREAKIVGVQSASRITDLFLIERYLTDGERAHLASLSYAEKRAFLERLETPVSISDEARSALLESNIILYGSGTQHSSLLPSYRTIGIREAIEASSAKVKIFIANVHEDHDTHGLSVADLVDRALYYLNDPQNRAPMVTHILCAAASSEPEKAPKNDLCDGDEYCSARVVRRPIESPVNPGIHSGSQVAREILGLYKRGCSSSAREIEIFIDLDQRSLALPYLLQEMLEIDWSSEFAHVEVFLSHVDLPPIKCPPYLTVRAAPGLSQSALGTGSDMEIVQCWLKNSRSKYLATLTGDGEYRLRDILQAIRVCEEHSFGAVYGSRNQSRRQFVQSIESAYSESHFLFVMSWFANFLISLLYGLRFQIIFSDPLTGFRVYERDATEHILLSKNGSSRRSTSYLTQLLLANNIEIAEIPISYRTYRGFTNVRWRIKRGLRHVFSLFV